MPNHDEFYPLYGEMETRLRHLEGWASLYSGRHADDSAVDEQAEAFKGNNINAGLDDGALSLQGDVSGNTSANRVDKLKHVALFAAADTIGQVYVYDATSATSYWRAQNYVQGDWGVGLTGSPTTRFQVDEGISRATFTNTGNTLSTLKGLHLVKTDRTSATSHGISFDVVPASGTLGYGQWEVGMDVSTSNTNGYGDLVLAFDATANAAAGADVLRISHEIQDSVVSSLSTKFMFGNGGSPVAQTAFATFIAGDTLTGMRISANTSASGRNHISLIQRAANNFSTVSFNNVLRIICDNPKANTVSLAIRDDSAGAIRLFMDASGRFGIGTATTITASLMLPAGVAAASGSPLKFQSGTNLTTAENGTAEYDGTDWFFTPSAATRMKVVLAPTSPAAYTQTYATADRTISAYTSDPESVGYTGIDNLQVGTPYAQVADLEALRVAYENLRGFAEDIGQAVNAVIDDAQAAKLLG